jgi:outer membrane protein assembly factor BamB
MSPVAPTVPRRAVLAAARGVRWSIAAASLALLTACSSLSSSSLGSLVGLGSSSSRPKPAELTPSPDLIGVRLAWTARLPSTLATLQTRVVDGSVIVASADGIVLRLDAQDGREISRTSLATTLTAGVGSDGKTIAVVTADNELVALQAGGQGVREAWRRRVGAQVQTAPLVAGERVFVLGADRAVTAFDAATGERLWQHTRPGEPLVLRQPGLLMAVGDTLVAGLSGRVVGFNPNTGAVRWEAALAIPRGSNDVERLVDVVAGVNRQGSVVCARAFQASVGCVDAARGSVLWTRPASGSTGVHGDAELLLGTEADGRVRAWNRTSGDPQWSTELLRWRALTAPQVLGRSVAIGDGNGFVHLLSRTDGQLLRRLSTDGSAIASAPVLAGQTLVVVTRTGGVYGFRPD